MGDDSSVAGDVISSIAPYLFLGIILYLLARRIGNIDLGGLVPDTSGLQLPDIFGGQQQRQQEEQPEDPGMVIIERETTGKRLEEAAQEQQRELQLERQGLDFKTFEEQAVEEEVRREHDDISRDRFQEEVAQRRAETRQQWKAAEQLVEGLETGRFTAGSESRDRELIQGFRESQELHRLTIKEQKEIARERKGLDEITPEEKRIREQKFQEIREHIPGDELTERQRRIARQTVAIERAKRRQEQQEAEQERDEKRMDVGEVVVEAHRQAARTVARTHPFGMAVEAGRRLLSGNDREKRQREREQDRADDADVLGFDVPFI